MLDYYLYINLYYLHFYKNCFLRTKCLNFKHPYKNNVTNEIKADGVLFFYKNDFLKINGFDNWRCGSDTDLMNRFELNNVKKIDVDIVTFLRRIHEKNLTINKDYNFFSNYRKTINDIIEYKKRKKIIKNFDYKICEKNILL